MLVVLANAIARSKPDQATKFGVRDSGLGPAATEVDDRVCLVLGEQVLYVLRNCEDNHHGFVAECYVHGMMDGQACDDGSFAIKDTVLV